MKKFLQTAAILLLSVGASAAIKTETIEYKEGETTLEGVLIYDDSFMNKRPGILIAHQWKGLTDYEKKRGEMLAKLGNSGQSDAPHLHFQLMDLPSLLASDGLPVELDFRLLGHVASLGVLTDGSGWKPDQPARMVHGQMPIENAVVEFPSINSSRRGCRQR